MNEKRGTVLRDHARKGKRLIPPALNVMSGRFSPYSWTRQITPEMIWLALLINKHGFRAAVNLATIITDASANVYSGESKRLFATLSSFSALDEGQQKQVASLINSEFLQDIRSALLPLNHITTSHPLSFIFAGHSTQSDKLCQSDINIILQEMYDRTSRTAVQSVAIAVYIGMMQGMIVHAPHLHEKRMRDFQDIVDYPNTEASKRAAGAFRASAPMFLISGSSDAAAFNDNEWISYFWDMISGFGPCIPYNEQIECGLNEEKASSDDYLENIIINYRNNAKSELKFRLDNWALDLNEREQHEVVGGLLARQTTLAIELAAAPAIWSPHVAPIVLRCMCDCFITLAWIMKDPSARAKMYIEDGLGAIKLENAHRKIEIEKLTDPIQIQQLQEMYDYWNGWIESQKMSQFVEVNLGNWSGLTSRKMAEEAGVLDFYNNVYQPFSAAVHSNWAHVSDKNSIHCGNPAHLLHRIPTIIDARKDPHWLYLAAKYLQKTLSLFDDFSGIKPPSSTAFDALYEVLYGEQEEE